MRLLDEFDEKLWLHHKEHLLRRSKTTPSLRVNENDENCYLVEPIMIRKTPKFPCRERHMAIRRKKPTRSLSSVSSASSASSSFFNSPQSSIECQCGVDDEKTCQSCKCPREAHAIYQEQITSVRERLGFKSENQSSGIDPRQLGYTWVPHGVMTSAKIQRYFDKIPQDKVPKIGTSGERYRERQLTYQLPKQDLSKEYCKHLQGAQQLASYEDFVAARNEIALDIGYIKDAPQNTKCINCNERISKGELAVIAPKFLDTMMWHPECFSCTTCDELLVDLTYCVHEDKIYCERHYAEMLKPRCSACDEEIEDKDIDTETSDKNVSMYETSQVVPSLSPARNLNASAYSNENKKSFETDENVIHDQQADELMQRLNSKLRRSPRQDDMEYYEERFIEEERKASRTPSPGGVEAKAQESSLDIRERDEQNSKSQESSQDLKEKTSQTPKIEIDYATDIENLESETTEDEGDDDNVEQSETLMEGVSDFYDFNASINPSRSPSRSPSRASSTRAQSSEPRSRSHSRISEKLLRSTRSRETSPYQTRSRSISPGVASTASHITGVSDWYDYNVMLNRKAYNIKVENFREAHESSTDFILSQLKTTNNIAPTKEDLQHRTKNELDSSPESIGGRPKGKERSITPELKRIKESSGENLEELEENNKKESEEENLNSNQTEEPPTPQYPRSFSAEWKDTERLKEDYKSKFKRSKYVGESIDFSDDFEELREQTRHFRRSRSKSRSPTEQDIENLQFGRMATRRKLQEKILAQITKTTLDYQDFSKDISREFLEHERRGSDSALIQKSQILIQFQDNQSRNGDYDDDDIIEAEEYHHFRRFSLNQEAQVEEYPDDESDSYVYDYIEQIDLKENYDHQLNNTFDTSEESFRAPLVSDDIRGEFFLDNEIAEDDQEDSGSDDERQTVVEVDDEIDEDICDFEKSDEFNEQSECEEAEREVDKYANRNAEDWKEEGAVGGVIEWENRNGDTGNITNIEDMYDDDALKYIEEGKMERDYETIIEAMNKENQNGGGNSNDLSDNISIKTEDLLDEILKEDEIKYSRLSPKQNNRYNRKGSSENFINKEEEDDVPYYPIGSSTVVHHNITSTRLRSRYGLPPSAAFRNYDYDLDDIEVDLNYKPKKEYNWRKKFKIDDDDDEQVESKYKKSSPNENTNYNYEENENGELGQLLDNRKYSLGGESITLYSRSLESEEEQLEIVSMEDEIHAEKQQREITNSFQENGYSSQPEIDSSLNQQEIKNVETSNNESAIVEKEQSEEVSKKKKTKKKLRKGSKASIGDEELSSIDNIADSLNKDDAQTNSKKKLKKKKKTKVNESILENSSPNNIKSPEPESKPEIKSFESNSNINRSMSKIKAGSFEIQQTNTNSTSLKLSPVKELSINNANSSESATTRLSPFSELSNVTSSSTQQATLKSIPTISSNKEPSSVKTKTNSPITRISPMNDEQFSTKANSPQLGTISPAQSSINENSKSPEPKEQPNNKPRPPLQRTDSSGVYDLIKDSSMYPWF